MSITIGTMQAPERGEVLFTVAIEADPSLPEHIGEFPGTVEFRGKTGIPEREYLFAVPTAEQHHFNRWLQAYLA
jgi:hypothetical protein